ncbi:hypothetical protein OF83DRAFT_1055103 [Amylostereum chailletii]|nr:hypothetical protein OF83DRAFT_1055103 [Amylostereum chailletii]
MRRTRPLPETHPEFLILETSGLCREYRVENWHLACDGSGKIISSTVQLSWTDALIALIVSVAWPLARSHSVYTTVMISMLGIYIYSKCTQVLWESVLVLPPHGLQFETHRGFPPYALFASRTFIPSSELRDLVINEGLRRWDVRYYIAAVYKPSEGGLRLHVAFESLIPRFPVLVTVYKGIHDCLLHAAVEESLQYHRYSYSP